MISILLLSAAFAQQAPTPEASTRQVLDLFLLGKYEAMRERFDERMRQTPPDTYSKIGDQLKSLGGLKKIGEPAAKTDGEYTTVIVRLDYAFMALDFSVTWNKAGQIAGNYFRPSAAAWKPPAYANPAAFTESELIVGEDMWKLPATLTLPNGRGPFPAIVLVHGSGPNDRDESVGGAKVFKDLAYGLASRGVAVLRYEKRTKAHAKEMALDTNFTMTTETVDDAIRAAFLLRKQPLIDPARVFVLGHSQGGYMMPRIMQRDPRLAGVIVMAGNVRPLGELIIEQTEYMNALRGNDTPEAKASLDNLRKNPLAMLKLPEHYIADLEDYHPDSAAKPLKIPMLILQGERDYQVTMKDFALWKAALSSRKDVVFRSYAKLNHLFIAGEGKPDPAEYSKGGNVDQPVIEDIANWIRARGI